MHCQYVTNRRTLYSRCGMRQSRTMITHVFMRTFFREHSLLLTAVLCLGALLTSCSDDPDPQVDHYSNPVWTGDEATVIAGHLRYRTDAASDRSLSILALRTAGTPDETDVNFAGVSYQKRYWAEPLSGVLAFDTGGIAFFSRTGTYLGTFTAQNGSVMPNAISFIAGGGEFAWAAQSGGHVVLGTAQYTDKPWLPASVTVVKDTASPAGVLDVVYTSASSYAVHLSDGTILEYGATGALRSQLKLDPVRNGQPWQQRLHYYSGAQGLDSRLYALDDSGLAMFDLKKKTKSIIIYGAIVNFDITNKSGFILFETLTPDVFIADANGIPLSRVVRGGRMPQFSNSGRKFTAVGKSTANIDSLVVVSF